MNSNIPMDDYFLERNKELRSENEHLSKELQIALSEKVRLGNDLREMELNLKDQKEEIEKLAKSLKESEDLRATAQKLFNDIAAEKLMLRDAFQVIQTWFNKHK